MASIDYIFSFVWAQKKSICKNKLTFSEVVLPRFELGLREPKTLVLPLHHSTITMNFPFLEESGAKIILFLYIAKYSCLFSFLFRNEQEVILLALLNKQILAV